MLYEVITQETIVAGRAKEVTAVAGRAARVGRAAPAAAG